MLSFVGPRPKFAPGPEGLFRGTKSVVAGKFPRCGPEPTEPGFFLLSFSFLLCWALLLAYMLFSFLLSFWNKLPFFLLRLTRLEFEYPLCSTKVCTKCLGTRETALIYCVMADPEYVDLIPKNLDNSQLD